MSSKITTVEPGVAVPNSVSDVLFVMLSVLSDPLSVLGSKTSRVGGGSLSLKVMVKLAAEPKLPSTSMARASSR